MRSSPRQGAGALPPDIGDEVRNFSSISLHDEGASASPPVAEAPDGQGPGHPQPAPVKMTSTRPSESQGIASAGTSPTWAIPSTGDPLLGNAAERKASSTGDQASSSTEQQEPSGDRLPNGVPVKDVTSQRSKKFKGVLAKKRSRDDSKSPNLVKNAVSDTKKGKDGHIQEDRKGLSVVRSSSASDGKSQTYKGMLPKTRSRTDLLTTNGGIAGEKAGVRSTQAKDGRRTLGARGGRKTMAFKGGKFTIIEEGVEGSNVHGLSALLGQLDEKRNARQREQDEVMERVQRRMAVGNDVLASQAGGVELGSLGVGLKNMVRKTLAPNSQAGKALKQAAEAADFGAEREEDRKEELAAVQEEDKEPVDDVPIYTSGIFAVKPDHQMAPVLRALNTRTLYGKLRFLCVLLVSSPDFDLIVIILIFVNCVSLSMFRPRQGVDSPWNQTLGLVELILNVSFTFELIARIIAVGGILTFLSYPWNLFDAVMVSVGYTQFVPATGEGSEGVRALRAIRALRPLRTITRINSLRSVVVCFMEAIPMLASVATMLIFFLFVFAVAGVQLFSEVYHMACVDEETGYQEQGLGLQDDVGCGSRQCPTDTDYNYTCLDIRRGTMVNVAGYDNVGTSLLTIFQIVTLSNWSFVMYRTMDSQGDATVLFFLVVIILGTYYIMILFLAVLKTKFGKAQEMYAKAAPAKKNGDNVLVKTYKLVKLSFALLKRRFISRRSSSSSKGSVHAGLEELDADGNDVYVERHIAKPKVWWQLPTYWWRRFREKTRYLVMQKYFNRFFMGCIVFNTILLAIEYHGMPDEMVKFLNEANLVLTQVFTVEVLLKIVGLGLPKFFGDNFNIFDLFVVLVSQIEILLVAFLSGASATSSLKTLRILKSFRVLRVFRMLRYMESLRKIGQVLLNSMSSFVSIGLLTLLFNIVFSIMGLHVYGHYVPDIGYPNFTTFMDSCVLIFQVLTMEDWEVIGYSYVRATNYSAMAFFVSWIIVGKYIFLTLFLAVTLEAFESKYDTKIADEVAEVVQEHLDSIYEMNGHVQGEQDGDGYSDGDASSRPASRRFSETSGGSLLPSESGTSLGNDVQVWRRSIDGTSSDEEDIQVVPFASDIGQLSDGASPLQDKSIVTPWGGGNIRADGWAEPPPLPGMMPDNDEANQDVVLPFFEPSERISLTRHDPASDMTSPLMPDDPTRPSAPAVGRRAPGSFTAAGPVAEELLPRLSNASAFTRESDGPENEDRKSIFTMEKRRFLGGKARKNFFSRLRRSLSLGHMSPRQERAAQLQKEIREARMLLGEELPEGSEETVSTRGKNNFPPLDGLSLWCIPATNPVRIFMYKLCTTKAFDHVMFFFIILSCAAMVYEHPFIEIDSLEHWVLYWLEVMLTIIFGLEAVIKIVSFGFTPYIRSVTNVIDLMIVVVGVLLLALDSVADDIPGIQGLGVLRAAKPLRALTRSQGMMLVFKSLSMSMMSMADVSIICLLFFFIFGIMGTQLFGGTFYYCTQPRNIDGALIDTREDCNGLGEDGEPLEWINGFPNFDHLGNSLLTLFMTSTLDGYAESMQLAMSIRGTDLQPRLGANTAAFIFFCLFIMVVAFCLLNLYVGVVFYQFSRIRMLSSAGAAFLTTGQHEWMEMSKLVFRLQPLDKVIVPKRRFRRLCHKICTNWAFEKMITATILVNVVFMALEHYNMSERLTDVTVKGNYVFTAIFVIEAIIKMLGHGWPVYWRNHWNKFDFFIVLASIFDLVISLLARSFSEVFSALKIQKLLQILRLSRMLKLVKSLKSIRSLLQTLIASLPAFWSVGALLILLFFIYAYIGVLVFGKVRINKGLNHHANFTRFWKALNVLLRVATNDDWLEMMNDCSATPPDCSRELGDCGSPVAQFYFSSFVALASIIMLNLFTAVIIENFEKQQEQDSWKLVPASLEEFRELWSEYDDGTRTITPRDLHDLLIRLTPPLGLGPTVTNIQLLKFVSGLNIPLVNGRVPFHRVLFELVRRVSETEIPEGKMKDGIDEMVSNAFGRGEEGDELMNFNIAIIVTRMQRKWRAVVASNKVKNSVARRRARTIPTVAMSDFHTLLERKADFRADVALSCLEGRPWKFDGADGMGHLADWAVQGLARPHGLRNQMSLMVRRQTRQPSEGQQGLSGFAGMMKRITLFSAPRKTKLGPQATEAHQGHATMEDLASQALLEVGESDEDEAEELRKLASPRNIFAGLHRAGWRSAVTRDSQH